MLVPSIRNGSMKHKLVSGSANRSDTVFAMAIGGKFPAKAANMHVEAAVKGIEFASENFLCQSFTLHDFAWRSHKNFQQGELHVRQVDPSAVLYDSSRGWIKHQIFHKESRGLASCRRRRTATADCTNTSQQLTRIEGFGQIVIRTDLETDDAVDILSTRR
jgi:hypothetical protein